MEAVFKKLSDEAGDRAWLQGVMRLKMGLLGYFRPFKFIGILLYSKRYLTQFCRYSFI